MPERWGTRRKRLTSRIRDLRNAPGQRPRDPERPTCDPERPTSVPGPPGSLPRRLGTRPGRMGSIPSRMGTLPDRLGTPPRRTGSHARAVGQRSQPHGHRAPTPGIEDSTSDSVPHRLIRGASASARSSAPRSVHPSGGGAGLVDVRARPGLTQRRVAMSPTSCWGPVPVAPAPLFWQHASETPSQVEFRSW